MGATLWTAAPESSAGQTRDALLSDAKVFAAVAAPLKMLGTFGYCHTGGGQNCVVDGDTFWMDGVKIRVADIDAPETHPPRCASEADLGNRATNRLHELLNAGPLELRSLPDRDEDRYGRKLRIVERNGQSLGDILVSEGLARTWTGRREPWC
jgi:endonuclease YncB( thermonuclease family)